MKIGMIYSKQRNHQTCSLDFKLKFLKVQLAKGFVILCAQSCDSDTLVCCNDIYSKQQPNTPRQQFVVAF